MSFPRSQRRSKERFYRGSTSARKLPSPFSKCPRKVAAAIVRSSFWTGASFQCCCQTWNCGGQVGGHGPGCRIHFCPVGSSERRLFGASVDVSPASSSDDCGDSFGRFGPPLRFTLAARPGSTSHADCWVGDFGRRGSQDDMGNPAPFGGQHVRAAALVALVLPPSYCICVHRATGGPGLWSGGRWRNARASTGSKPVASSLECAVLAK